MKRVLALIGSLALIPAAVGPLPASARSFAVALCGGGSVTLPASPAGGPADPPAPCCAKGCHGGSQRKRIDRSQ